jgi:two-component system OmpR family sensor kinase
VTRRRALAVFAAAAALLVAVNAVMFSLYRSEVRAIEGGLDDRLVALGTTAAKWLAGGGDGDAALAALVDANRLEDAYVVDASRQVTAGVRTRAGAALNMLRVDPDRLAAARDGKASSGPGYSIEQHAVETAYFPIGDGRVLALEAGAEYRAPATRVYATYVVAVALTVLVALLFAVGLGLALRSLERARVAYGRAERLAAVGQMAAMVAHEVRNPLGILRAQVELAREKLGDRERERMTDMLAEIDRLNRLTEEFLNLARDVPIERAPVDLAALVRAIADEARVTHARLEVSAPEPIEIAADAGKLRQAILNLVLNAAQVGGDAVTVRLELARAGERARVTIADDGPGIPAELAATLFEPFVSARPGGSGLGLAVARRIAERHGGSLVLESPPGAPGARFSIYLPLRGST